MKLFTRQTTVSKTRTAFVALAILVVGAQMVAPVLAEAQQVFPTLGQCIQNCPYARCGANPNGSGFLCSPPLLSPEAIVEGTISEIISAVLLLAKGIAALLLGISGVLLNTAIEITVVKAALIVNQIGAIGEVWALVRDVVSMLFIFILLYSSILTILCINAAETKKVVTNLIIAGLLMNFTLTFTQGVFDASNILTYEFYKPIAARADIKLEDIGNPDTVANPLTKAIGFAGAFTDTMGLVTIEDVRDVGKLTKFDNAVRLAMSTIVILVAAFVFFLMAMLLVIRLGVFILLMATSAVAVLGFILPKNNKLSEMWWTALWSQAQFAPAFMLLSLIAYMVLDSPVFKTGGILAPTPGGFSSAFAGNGVMVIVFNYILVIMFLVAAVTIARNLASQSAKKLVDRADKWANSARAFVGRQTAGRAARRAGKIYDERIAAPIAASGFAKSKFAKYTGLAAVGKTVDRGLRGGLKKGEDYKYGGKYNLADIEKQQRERTIGVNRVEAEMVRERAIKRGLDSAQQDVNTNFYNPNSEEAEGLRDAMKELSDKELLEMLENNIGQFYKGLKGQILASQLTQSQMDALEKAAKDNLIRPEALESIKDAREEGLTRLFDAAGPAHQDKMATVLTKGDPSSVVKLPKNLLKKPSLVSRFTPSVLGGILQDTRFNETDRNEFRVMIETEAKKIPEKTKRKTVTRTLPNGRVETLEELYKVMDPQNDTQKRMKNLYDYLQSPMGQAF